MKTFLYILGGLFLFGGAASRGTGRPAKLAPLPPGLKKYHLKIRERQLKYLPFFEEATKKYKSVPLPLALAVGHGEGSGNPLALSHAGALGLMQLMPATARGLGLTVNETIDQRKDPRLNVLAGVKLLAQLFKKQKRWDRVLAAYNSGNPDPEKRQSYIKYIRSFLPLYEGF